MLPFLSLSMPNYEKIGWKKEYSQGSIFRHGSLTKTTSSFSGIDAYKTLFRENRL